MPAERGCALCASRMIESISLEGITEDRWVDLRFCRGFTMGDWRTLAAGPAERGAWVFLTVLRGGFEVDVEPSIMSTSTLFRSIGDVATELGAVLALGC